MVFILLLELNGPDPAQGERLRIEVAENVVTLTDLSAVAVTGFRGTYDCGSAGKPTSVVEDFVILGMGTAAST